MKLTDQQAQELHNLLHIYWQQLTELHDILIREKQSIASRQFEEFSRVLEHKNNLLNEVTQFDESLAMLMKKIVKKPTKHALQNTINAYDGQLGKPLKLLLASVQDIAEKCRRANEINSKVVAHAQQHYSRIISIIRREDPDAKTYAKDGRYSNVKANGTLGGGRLAQA